MNKKILIAGCLILAIIALSGCQAKKSVKNEPQEYLASGHPEWSPIMWRLGDQIVGVGPELVRKVFSALGLKVESRYTGLWDEVQAKAKDGQVDLLVAAYKTAERETYLDYSVAYTEDPIAIFVKKTSTLAYNKWEDLIGKKGVLMIGDSYGQEFDDFIKEKLTTERVKTVEDAFAALENNTVDYFVYALYAGEKIIAEKKLEEKIKIMPQYVAAENFYLAISKKSPLVKYLPQINEQLEKFKQDGTIKNLIEQYKKEVFSTP